MADEHHDSDPGASDHGHDAPHGYTDAGSHALPGGLTVAVERLQLEASETRVESGETHEWTFQIDTEDGNVVTAFERPTINSRT